MIDVVTPRVMTDTVVDGHSAVEGGCLLREAAGHWVTIKDEDGISTHVFIGSGGLVEKGPRHLVGANIAHLPPGPHHTIHHPEGHTPAGHDQHPDYHEHKFMRKVYGQHGPGVGTWVHNPLPHVEEGEHAKRLHNALQRAREAHAHKSFKEGNASASDAAAHHAYLHAHSLHKKGHVSNESHEETVQKINKLHRAARIAEKKGELDTEHHRELNKTVGSLKLAHDVATGKGLGHPTPKSKPEPPPKVAKGPTPGPKTAVGKAKAAAGKPKVVPPTLPIPPGTATGGQPLGGGSTAVQPSQGTTMAAKVKAAAAGKVQGSSGGALSVDHILSGYNGMPFLHHGSHAVSGYKKSGAHNSAPKRTYQEEGTPAPGYDTQLQKHTVSQSRNAMNWIPNSHMHLVNANGAHFHFGGPMPPSNTGAGVAAGRYHYDNGRVEVFNHPEAHRTLLHETGHAVDHALGMSSHNSDFRAIYSKHQHNAKLWNYMRSKPAEMYAEGYSMFHRGGADNATLKADAPELHAYMAGAHAHIEGMMAKGEPSTSPSTGANVSIPTHQPTSPSTGANVPIPTHQPTYAFASNNPASESPEPGGQYRGPHPSADVGAYKASGKHHAPLAMTLHAPPEFNHSHESKQGVEAALKSLPASHHKLVQAHGVAHVLRGKPPLLGVREGAEMRGAGVYDHSSKVMHLFDDPASYTTTVHETGHAVDHALGWASDNGHFQGLYKANRNNRRLTDYARSNSKETFAHAYESYHGDKRTRNALKADAPDLHRYMEGLHNHVEKLMR